MSKAEPIFGNAPDNVPIAQPTPAVTDSALVGDALEYVEACVGGPYVVWEGGRFTNSAPAWVAASPPPPADVIRSNGGVCARLPPPLQPTARVLSGGATNARARRGGWGGGALKTGKGRGGE